jgi:hypothetical protein
MPHHLPRVMSSRRLPHHLYGRTTCTVSMPRGTVRTVQSSPFFACLGFRTERDIFRIRSPFDEVNIWPESRRRDGRNGIGFVGFRALSFLSIFKPCQASGSDSGSNQLPVQGRVYWIRFSQFLQTCHHVNFPWICNDQSIIPDF